MFLLMILKAISWKKGKKKPNVCAVRAIRHYKLVIGRKPFAVAEFAVAANVRPLNLLGDVRYKGSLYLLALSSLHSPLCPPVPGTWQPLPAARPLAFSDDNVALCRDCYIDTGHRGPRTIIQGKAEYICIIPIYTIYS